eukprot:scaffold107777_cov37-Tisochrysis_lutea.AAC.1
MAHASNGTSSSLRFACRQKRGLTEPSAPPRTARVRSRPNRRSRVAPEVGPMSMSLDFERACLLTSLIVVLRGTSGEEAESWVVG